MKSCYNFEAAGYVYLEGTSALFLKILSAKKKTKKKPPTLSQGLSVFTALFKVKAMMPMKFEIVETGPYWREVQFHNHWANNNEARLNVKD